MSFSIQYDVAEEVLDQIISTCSRSSLAALCLSCKKLRRIATPYLYSVVVFDQSDKIKKGEPLQCLLPFTYLMFTSPFHASLVKSLVVPDNFAFMSENRVSSSSVGLWPRSGTRELESLLRAKSAEYGIDENEASEIYSKIALELKFDTIFALLCANLPNLQKLDINCGSIGGRSDIITMMERVAQRRKPFSKVPLDLSDIRAIEEAKKTIGLASPIDVMVKYPTGKRAKDPGHFGSFLNLPHLRSIHTYFVGDDGGEDDERRSKNSFAKLRPCSCAVENIELRRSHIHDDNLQCLLNACVPGRLKTFIYELAGGHSTPAFSKRLEAHYDTLESLTLTSEYLWAFEPGNPRQEAFSVSFASFKNLKRLKISPIYVWGRDKFRDIRDLLNPQAKEMLWKALPSSIEELWLHMPRLQHPDIHHRLNRQFREFFNGTTKLEFLPDCLKPALDLVFQHKTETFPRLNSLRIELELRYWGDHWLDLLSSFGNRAEENGIRYTIILAGNPHDGAREVERNWGFYENLEFDPIEQNQEYAKRYISFNDEAHLIHALKDSKAEWYERHIRDWNDKYEG